MNETPHMRFWRAINEARALAGKPEALFGNVHNLWQAAMEPTLTEVEVAVQQLAKRKEG